MIQMCITYHLLVIRILSFFSPLRQLSPLGATSETQGTSGAFLPTPSSFSWGGDDVLRAAGLPHGPARPHLRGADFRRTHREVDHKATEFPGGLLLHPGLYLPELLTSPLGNKSFEQNIKTRKKKTEIENNLNEENITSIQG